MKSIRIFLAMSLACAFVTSSLLAADQPAKQLTCCEQAAQKGKECTHKCCVAAHRDGKSCEKCNPAKQDAASLKKPATSKK